MTQNQIAYWQLQETKRSNMVREGETNRSNLAKEHELNRSNVAMEELKDQLQKAQFKRWQVQNGTDIANSVTRGLKDVSTAGKNISDIIGDWVPGKDSSSGSIWDEVFNDYKSNPDKYK